MIKKNGQSGPQMPAYEAAVYEVTHSCPTEGCARITSRYQFRPGQPHFIEHKVFHCLHHQMVLRSSAPKKIETPRIITPVLTGVGRPK